MVLLIMGGLNFKNSSTFFFSFLLLHETIPLYYILKCCVCSIDQKILCYTYFTCSINGVSKCSEPLNKKKKYIQATRAQNYQASLKLEGITTTAQTTQQSKKAEILQKYKKYSQPET
jgi:hypothetical protein